MSDTYKIKVNELYEFNFDTAKMQDINLIHTSDNIHLITKENTSYQVEVDKENFADKEYQIRVNGNLYKVQLQDELDTLIKELGLTVGAKQKDANVIAPMPGLILEIQVKDGQEVKEGDPLLVLEAMKMENVLVAPKDGIIKGIKVAKGDAVDKKQLLIEME